MTSLENRESGTANSKIAAWCRPKAGFGFEWCSQFCVLRACHLHSWSPQPRFCKKAGHIINFTAKLSVFSIRLRCPGGNVDRQVLLQEGPSIFMGGGVTKDPWKSDLGEHLTPAVSKSQGRCLPGMKWKLSVAFDVSLKCSYVMTLTRGWGSKYCLCSLGACFFILFIVTSEKKILKHFSGGLAIIIRGHWWGLIPFDINILGRAWKSVNLQDSQTDSETQHCFEGTKLGSYWLKYLSKSQGSRTNIIIHKFRSFSPKIKIKTHCWRTDCHRQMYHKR